MPANEFTVFYAWQSDSERSDNRSFIESALDTALKGVAKAGVIEASPRLDKDTKDIPGIPDIANTILEKIRGADCFLCDVSFVGSTPPDKKSRQDPIPNPNVMIELGYALSELGWERIVLVINTATGKPEDLPFDLRNRRWPIGYEVGGATDEASRSAIRKQLARQIQSAIEAIAKLPARQKRGTNEQRISALEEIVGKLSGNVAQYATLANLVAGLQHAGSVQQPPLPDAKAKCEALRASLVEKVTAGQFENVVVRHGMFLVVICPASSPSPLPIFDGNNEQVLTMALRPLYASGWDHRRYGNRLVTFSRWDKEIDAATEITVNGVISAVGHAVMSVPREFLNEKAPEDLLYIPSVAYEKSVIEALVNYMKALSNLGTKGPWHVALGIANLKKTALYVGARFAFGGRVFEGREIMPPVVVIDADADLANPQTIARALRPAFDFVWREHNYPQSLNYGETGDWIGH